MRQIIVLLCPPLIVAAFFCFGLSLALAPSAVVPQGRHVPLSAAPQKKHREPLLSEVIEVNRKREGLLKGQIEAHMWVESRFDEHAFNPEKSSDCYKAARTDGERRRCSSSGLMQVVERWHGRPRDWQDNIHRGARKLGECFRKHRDVYRAAVCYNGTGPAARAYAAKVVKEFHIWKSRA